MRIECHRDFCLFLGEEGGFYFLSVPYVTIKQTSSSGYNPGVCTGLHLIGVVVDLSDHGLGSIEQRAVAHADDVRGDDRILVVAEALGAAAFMQR